MSVLDARPTLWAKHEAHVRRCVNSHAGLIAALRKIDDLSRAHPYACATAGEIARAALKAAEAA